MASRVAGATGAAQVEEIVTYLEAVGEDAGGGFEADGGSAGEDDGEGVGVEGEAAAAGDNARNERGGGRRKEFGDEGGFEAAEGGFAVGGEDFGDGAAGAADDFVVGIEEGDAKAPGKAGAERGFAGAHEAEKEEGLGNDE